MCPDSNSMDQRDEYWGEPVLRHDLEDYNGPQHYESLHSQRQQQQHRLPHPIYAPAHVTVAVPQHLQHRHPRYDQQQQPLSHASRHNATIGVVDVLCGRGKTSFNHEGNKTFRSAVSAALDDFVNAVNRFEKGIVVQRVVDMVHSRGGRFLKEDTRAGTWFQLSEQQSKEKVGHAIRDAANLYEVRKQKEGQMQQLVHQDNTPQLKRIRSDDDDNSNNKQSGWWASYGDTEETSLHGSTTGSKGDRSKSYRSSYASTDYSVDYSTTSAAKRRGSTAPSQPTDYQPQQKRRRTASPSQTQSYFHSTMALSDHILSTPSPQTYNNMDDPFAVAQQQQHTNRAIRRSPIIHQVPTTSSNLVSSGGSQKSSSGGGVIMTNVSSKLKRSPIDPIVPPPASSKHPSSTSSSSSHQYFHQFTVYDPQQQQEEDQLSSTKSTGSKHHRQFHPEIARDDSFTSPLEETIPQAEQRQASSISSAQYSGISYPYGRSDFTLTSLPPSSSFYDERHYQPPPSPYGPYRTTSVLGILPPMGHLQQHYPHQHYAQPPQHGSMRPYAPQFYYQTQPRGKATTPCNNVSSDWDTGRHHHRESILSSGILQEGQEVEEEGERDGTNGTNSDTAVAPASTTLSYHNKS